MSLAPSGGGWRRVCCLGTGVTAPAGQQQGERGEQREHDRERDEVGGQVEAVRARQRQHRRAVLGDERALDLRFGLAFVDQALDELPLAVRLRRLGDLEAGFCR